MKLSKHQRWAVLGGIAVIAVMTLFPPLLVTGMGRPPRNTKTPYRYNRTEYHFLFGPSPQPIHFARLAMQYVLAVTLTGGVVYFHGQRNRDDS